MSNVFRKILPHWMPPHPAFGHILPHREEGTRFHRNPAVNSCVIATRKTTAPRRICDSAENAEGRNTRTIKATCAWDLGQQLLDRSRAVGKTFTLQSHDLRMCQPQVCQSRSIRTVEMLTGLQPATTGTSNDDW